MSGFFADGRWWDVDAAEQAVIREAAERLHAAGIAEGLSEAQRLFVHARTGGGFDDLIDRRAARSPMSHLLGYRDFYKHRFRVTPDVLDPRPETEALVVEALRHPFQTVLDLGTGSGCILLSLLVDRPEARGVGIDLSQTALGVARLNAEALDLSGRAELLQSDWYAKVDGCFDLIVSNPPYIAQIEMADLAPEVLMHEPRGALTDEGDGLACYRVIVAGAAAHLTTGGRLMEEIGPTQAPDVAKMMAQNGFADIAVLPDLDGRDRVVSAVLDQN